MNPFLAGRRPYPMVELQNRKAALMAEGIELFDFGTGDPIEPTPAHIRQALIDALPEISQYPSVSGTPALRKAAADYYARRFAVQLDPHSQILPSAGSKEAIFHLALAMVDPSSGRDTVLYGSPAYPVYELGALFAQARPQALPLDAAHGWRLPLDTLQPELLERTALLWINYPHNPSGAGVDLAYLREVYTLCRCHDILLCSDECYTDLWFEDPPPPSLLQCGQEGCLVFHSCSKRSGMTGYRSGFIAGDPHYIARYRRWRASMGVGSPSFIEAAAAAAWSDDAHAAERRRIFADKYHCLRQGLQERGIEILPSAAGLYLWARVPAGYSSASYAQACLEAGIIISPGDFFGPEGAGFFRLALVPSQADCQRALARWPSHA